MQESEINPHLKKIITGERQFRLLEKQESIEKKYTNADEGERFNFSSKFTNLARSLNSWRPGSNLLLELEKQRATIADGGLFDVEYYREQGADINGVDSIEHYIEEGARRGLNPHPLFDTAYYREQIPELEMLGVNPLVHYLTTNGPKPANPHPLFDSSYYLAANPHLAGGDTNLLIHYLESGGGPGPHPLFDGNYYRAGNPDVARLAIDPLVHYLRYGSRELRDPHPLFDTSYYLEHNPDVALSNVNPLVHYLRHGGRENRDPHPLFSSGYYLEHNPDVARSDINPLVHYLLYGFRELRDPHPLFDVAHYFRHNPGVNPAEEPLSYYFTRGAGEGHIAWSAERLGSILDTGPLKEKYEVGLLLAGLQSSNLRYSLSHRPKIAVYCSTLGNYFMGEIADLLAAAFERLGAATVRRGEEEFNPDAADYNIVVAPHEFFYLGEGVELANRTDWLSRTVMVNVEQPQTAWFSRSLHLLRRAALVFDINIKTATFLRRIGMDAYFLPLGYLPDYQPFSFRADYPDSLAVKSVPRRLWEGVKGSEADWAERPIDLLFVGYLSGRRESFFVDSATWLHKYKCFLHVPPLGGPFLHGRGNSLTTEAFAGLSQRSKILLNVHQSDLDYFEWHRIIFYGLWQRTLVLTESCHRIPGLIPGEHYLQCELKDMRSKIEWLLNTDEGRREADKIRHDGHEMLKNYLDLERITGRLLNLTDNILRRVDD